MNGSAHEYDYDLVVIGGGSGGLAASKQAAKLGAKVACLDFVTPSPQGTRWGLGGTCVNVGCIPKKLMHQAAILGEQFSDAREFGWSVDGKPAVSWEKMVEAIQNHVGSLNWGYRVALRDKDVKYINARGVFTDPHTIVATKANGKSETITAAKFIIAVGGRPSYLGVPGDKECCITSDDIFSLPTTPGKTLVVGASYIALECAGFLTNLGFDTTVVSRSIFLRGFDQEIANMIAEYMERHGTRMLRKCTPVKFEKLESGKIAATIRNNDFGLETVEEFDTVLLAVGRTAITKDMGLDLAGVKFDPKTGKIPVVNEQTNVPHIYAIGDVLENRQELTPVAIAAGKLLARRLYAGETTQTDYDLVPTTVFTPLEYACNGMSEELATETYGAENLEVYITYFKPLEWSTNHEEKNGVAHREDSVCYCKLICNLQDNERVVGFHYLGPNAGEVMQGYALAMKLGATKADFDRVIGIHPTCAENFTTIEITKRSGLDARATGC